MITDDVRQEKRDIVIERKHEWLHGAGGLGNSCERKGKPIYTDPQKIPDSCRGWMCNNEEWRSNGIVQRDKATKQIIRRENS
jgi:hypothetical protein